MKVNNASRSSGAKGRIAQVLAQARASLKEPSRPYTPASLDARTEIGMGPPSSIDYSVSTPMHDSITEGFRKSKSVSKTSKKTSNSLEKQSNELNLLMLDLQDEISIIETETNVTTSDYYRLEELLQDITNNIDKLSKFIRNTGSDLSVQIEMKSLCKSISKVLGRVADDIQPRRDLQQLACRHILKVYLALLIRCSSNPTTTTTMASLTAVPSNTARVLLRTISTMYQLRQKETEQSVDSPGADEAVLRGGVELLQELMFSVWQRVNSFDNMDSSSHSSGSSSNGDEDGETTEFTDGINDSSRDAKSGGSNQSQRQSHLILLEAAMYAAGILRTYSVDEVNRRRLLVLGVIENVTAGLRAALLFATQQKATSKQQQQQQRRVQTDTQYSEEGGGGGGSSGDGGASTSNQHQIRTRATLTQLSHILVQLVGTLRNFSLDAIGRQKLLQAQTLPQMCKLLHSFPEYPDLRLNCVRVTAKLSLQEPFRSQINNKPKNVVYLVEVILQEAQMCHRIMLGHDSDSESISWPSWSTWPLLSRAAFTLGNLTTSNDANRVLIGIQCNLLKPLVTLLQACACSLTLLSCSDDDEDEEEEAKEKDTGSGGSGSGAGMGRNRSLSRSTSGGSNAKASSSIRHVVVSNGVEAKDAATGRSRPETLGKYKNKKKSRDDDIIHSLNSSSLSRDRDEGDNDDVQEGQGQTAGEDGDDADDNDDGKSELIDATVKLLRLVANLCMDADIGVSLARRRESLEMLLELLTCATADPSQEELLLNVVATCTNITYYACNCQPQSHRPSTAESSSPRAGDGNEESSFNEESEKAVSHGSQSRSREKERDKNGATLVSISIRLAQCLFHDNEEIVLEAARAMGNLTRRIDVLRSLQTSLADEAFILLLNHSNMDIVTAVTGALINQSAEPMCLGALLETGRPALALVSVLRRVSFKDLMLSTLICQVFHNMLLHGDGLDLIAELSLKGTLEELLACAEDFGDESKYVNFIEVGNLKVKVYGALLLLLQRTEQHETLKACFKWSQLRTSKRTLTIFNRHALFNQQFYAPIRPNLASANPAPNRTMDSLSEWENEIRNYGVNKRAYGETDTTSAIVMIIRTHGSYVGQTISMLAMLETIKHINISAILLPTELGSFEVLKKGLDRRHFIYNANMKDRHRDRLKISLMAIPPIIYDKYGSINAELCSEESRAGWAKAGHPPSNIATWCRINSPLHYFLVDVAMAYVKQQCLNSQLLVVTNADNYYSPNYFQAILSRVDKYDLILTNMINRNRVLNVFPKYEQVDLGAVAVSIPFLRRTGINFINSIPDPTHAGYFHSLDGFYVENLPCYQSPDNLRFDANLRLKRLLLLNIRSLIWLTEQILSNTRNYLKVPNTIKPKPPKD
eukprot:gene468-876_t